MEGSALDRFIAEAEERASNATPGPWHACEDEGLWTVAPGKHNDGLSYVMCDLDGSTAAFIAHARVDLPRALEMLRVLRDGLVRLGSMEAFDVARCVHMPDDKELVERIDYARAALARVEALAKVEEA